MPSLGSCRHTVNIMRKISLLLCLLFITSITASAHYFEAVNSDGVTIYYNINDDGKSVSVTFKGDYYGDEEYTGEIVIPEEVTYHNKNFTVTTIGVQAFCGCSKLKSVVIPNSVTSIEAMAFALCI